MRILTTIILLSIILFGCDNEIDLLDEQKSFPIAYCFLNPEDDSYYVSLTKSVNAATNAYDLVSQPSNVFYDTATVRLSAWKKDSLIWETGFAKSDFVKNPGIFPQASGYLYKSNHCINETRGVLEKTKHLKLEIQIPSSNDSLVSIIPLIHYPRFKRPAHGDITAYFVPNPFEIHLKSPDRNEYYKELSMTFNYKDIFENHEIDQDIEIVLAKYLYALDGVVSTPLC